MIIKVDFVYVDFVFFLFENFKLNYIHIFKYVTHKANYLTQGVPWKMCKIMKIFIWPFQNKVFQD